MEDIVIKTLALFILIFVSSCAAANQMTISDRLQYGHGRFEVKRVGDLMISEGCFHSQDAMWNEALKVFMPVVRQCPKLIDSIDSEAAASEGAYCIAVAFPAYFKCE